MKTCRPACPLIKGLLLTLCILFLFNSCQKEDLFGLDPTVQPQASLLGESQVFFRKLTEERPLQATPQNPRHRTAKTPLWNQAEQVQLSIGPALKVPLVYERDLYTYLGKKRDKVSLSELSYLLIYKDPTGKLHAEVVIRIPNEFYWDNRHRPQISYSGKVVVEDWWGNFIKSYYQHGADRIEWLGRPEVFNRYKYSRPGDDDYHNLSPKFWCGTDWYDCVSLEGGLVYQCRYAYSEYGCEGGGDDGDNNPGRGSGGGGPGPRDYGEQPRGGGGGRRNDNPPQPDEAEKIVKEIKNNLQNACLRSTLTSLINKDLKNQIGYILKEVFQESKSYNLDFSESYSMADYTSGEYDPNYILDDNNHATLYIKLNGNILPNAAKEFTTIIMIHEAIHGYFEVVGQHHVFDHAVMSAGYRAAISEVLLQLFPNTLSQIQAESLAWEGLISNQLERHEIWEDYRRLNPIKANDIINNNSAFRSGQNGTRCAE